MMGKNHGQVRVAEPLVSIIAAHSGQLFAEHFKFAIVESVSYLEKRSIQADYAHPTCPHGNLS
jgi:hypothetical protein